MAGHGADGAAIPALLFKRGMVAYDVAAARYERSRGLWLAYSHATRRLCRESHHTDTGGSIAISEWVECCLCGDDCFWYFGDFVAAAFMGGVGYDPDGAGIECRFWSGAAFDRFA